MSQPQPKAVTVSLNQLKTGDVPLETLIEAFGSNSLGILLVCDLPESYATLRHRLLSLSSHLANLPADELAKLEKPDAKYALGWSHGKEKLADGRYDTLKGFYHAQPIHNDALEAKARKLYPDFIEFVAPNVWPTQHVLPDFEQTFEALAQMVVDIAALVARACDRFGEAKLAGYRAGTLETIVRESVSTKGRLLHYFPLPAAVKADEDLEEQRVDSAAAVRNDDDWCATHCDLGALTGLTSQMFVDEHAYPPGARQPDGSFPLLPELDSHPDPKAGLWIRDRSGRVTQVDIPRDCLAFQTGSALELISRGSFKAVPHFVRGAESGNGGEWIARNTLAVFTQPNLWEMVDEDRDFATFARQTFEQSMT